MEQAGDGDTTTISIRPVQPDEIQQAVSILQEVARWLAARGISQWNPDDFTISDVRNWLSNGTVLVAWSKSEAIGTISLSFLDDALWQSVPSAHAAYVHKLAVRRVVAGQGVSVRLLHAAEAFARAYGCEVVRLDCWAGNAALRRFYASASYTLHGIVPEQDWECALFEKKLTHP